jgi:hypothetical protein
MDSVRFDMIYLSRGSGGAPQSLPTVFNAVPFLLFSCSSLDLSTKSHASGDFRNEQHSYKVDLRNCILTKKKRPEVSKYGKRKKDSNETSYK